MSISVTTRTRTWHHSLYNNLLINHRAMLDINYPSHRGGPQRIDHNVHDAASDDPAFVINSASDKPSPWLPDEFQELIHRDLGADSPPPVAIDEGRKAGLTLDQWRDFWTHHGLENDRHSMMQQGFTVSFAGDRQELSIDVPMDPSTVGSTNHDWIDNDFHGNPVPQDGRALPGPFQTLKQGRHVLRVWNGLPILGRGQLPQQRSAR